MTLPESELDALAALLPHFDVRRLGWCPYCKCTAAWINSAEFGRHMLQCVRIEQGLHPAVVYVNTYLGVEGST